MIFSCSHWLGEISKATFFLCDLTSCLPILLYRSIQKVHVLKPKIAQRLIEMHPDCHWWPACVFMRGAKQGKKQSVTTSIVFQLNILPSTNHSDQDSSGEIMASPLADVLLSSASLLVLNIRHCAPLVNKLDGRDSQQLVFYCEKRIHRKPLKLHRCAGFLFMRHFLNQVPEMCPTRQLQDNGTLNFPMVQFPEILSTRVLHSSVILRHLINQRSKEEPTDFRFTQVPCLHIPFYFW